MADNVIGERGLSGSPKVSQDEADNSKSLDIKDEGQESSPILSGNRTISSSSEKDVAANRKSTNSNAREDTPTDSSDGVTSPPKSRTSTDSLKEQGNRSSLSERPLKPPRESQNKKLDSSSEEEKANPSSGSVKKSLSFKETKETEENTDGEKQKEKEEADIVIRNKNKDGENKEFPNKRMSFFSKAKGKLFYKKKGTFAKWKEHFIVLDDSKMQMNFFKSQEEYENLARCKLAIDLRFVTEIKAQKPTLLQSKFPFKMHRRAALSTVKLAALNEDERARWITGIEVILKRMKMAEELESIEEEKRSSTLPNRRPPHSGTSSDSETLTTGSAPDADELIRPKKLSTSSGFKLNPHQISSVKLKRISSEKKEKEFQEEEEEENDEVFDPKEKFGVNLRRTNTDKMPPRDEREKSPEFIEFKQKYNSLSLSRQGKSPKLPLNEKLTCSHLMENFPKDELKVKTSPQPGNKLNERDRKRSPSPNIPISKSVEAVIKNNVPDEKLNTTQEKVPQLNVCHATSTDIVYEESSDMKLDETNLNQEMKGGEPDIVSSSTVAERTVVLEESHCSPISNKPDILEPSGILSKKELIETPDNTVFSCEKDGNEEACKVLNTPKENTEDKTFPLVIPTINLNTNTPSSDKKNRHSSEDQDLEGNTQENENSSDIQTTFVKTNQLPQSDANSANKSRALDERYNLQEIKCNEENEPENSTVENEKEVSSSNLEENIETLQHDRKFGCEMQSKLNEDTSLEAKDSEVNTEISGNNDPENSVNSDGSKIKTDSDADKRENSEELQENLNETLTTRPMIETEIKPGEEEFPTTASSSYTDKITEKDEGTAAFKLMNSSSESPTSTFTDAKDNTEVVKDESVKTVSELEENVTTLHCTSDTSENNNFTRKETENIENGNKFQVNEALQKTQNNSIESEKSDEVSKQTEDKIGEKGVIDQLCTEENGNDTSSAEVETPEVMEVGDDKENEISDLKETISECETSPKLENFQGTSKEDPLYEQMPSSHAPKSNTEDSNIYNNDLANHSLETSISDDTVLKLNENPQNNKLAGTTKDNPEPETDIRHSNKVPNESIDCLDKTEQDNKHVESIPTTSVTERPIVLEHLQEENKTTLRDVEFEETQDYFPVYGSAVEYRIKDGKLAALGDASLRTSGITGLKNFLMENENDLSDENLKSGISRLGHSPDIEKLRKEVP